MAEEYWKEVKQRLFLSAVRTNSAAGELDLRRNRVNYGTAVAYSRVLNDLGHVAEIHVFKEADMMKISRISVDGESSYLYTGEKAAEQGHQEVLQPAS